MKPTHNACALHLQRPTGEICRPPGHAPRLGAGDPRARLPLAYTQGFNPQARLQFGGPALPVGFTGQGEVADVFLNEALEPAEFLAG